MSEFAGFDGGGGSFALTLGQFASDGLDNLGGFKSEGERADHHLTGEESCAILAVTFERGEVQSLMRRDHRATAGASLQDPFAGQGSIGPADGVDRDVQSTGGFAHAGEAGS